MSVQCEIRVITPTDMGEMSRINTCVAVSEMLLSVVVDIESEKFNGRQSRRTTGCRVVV